MKTHIVHWNRRVKWMSDTDVLYLKDPLPLGRIQIEDDPISRTIVQIHPNLADSHLFGYYLTSEEIAELYKNAPIEVVIDPPIGHHLAVLVGATVESLESSLQRVREIATGNVYQGIEYNSKGGREKLFRTVQETIESHLFAEEIEDVTFEEVKPNQWAVSVRSRNGSVFEFVLRPDDWLLFLSGLVWQVRKEKFEKEFVVEGLKT